MGKNKMNKNKMDKNKISSKLTSIKKKPKVQLNLEKEEFSEDLQNLFNETPIIRQEGTFKNVTSNYIIDNIRKSNIPL